MEYKLAFKEYNRALEQDKLLGLKCQDCGAITVPPQMVCGKCASSSMDIVELSGRGEVQTFTTVYVAPEGRQDEVPYIIVLVKLDEGPWIMGNLIGIDPDQATMELIGSRAEMGHKVFRGDKYSDGEAARPLFSPETSHSQVSV